MSRRLVFGYPKAVYVIDRRPKRRVTADHVVMVACLAFLAAMVVWRWTL